MQVTFSNIGVSSWLTASLTAIGITQPTPIQQDCIPHILKGKDVIGTARTGQGKTATFALPILQHLSKDAHGVFALILTPTRELAFQIAEQFRVLGGHINLKQAIIVGGLNMTEQALELSKRPHVVIATPGRLVDLIKSSSDAIHFGHLKYLVLDEADRLLHPSFIPDVELIIKTLPKQRQNLLFTATLTPEMRNLEFNGNKPHLFQSPEHLQHSTVTNLIQKYLLVPSQVRDAYLIHLFQTILEKNTSSIIFVNKCATAQRLVLMMQEMGVRCTGMHAKMQQKDRIGSLAKFKSMIVNVLVTTDVGSRGLDIPSVRLVVNYDIPCDATDYVHRVGRTARAGKGGMSLSFISERDITLIENIEQKTGVKMELYEEIEEKDVLEMLNKVAMARKTAMMKLVDSKFGEKQKVHSKKKEERDGARAQKNNSSKNK